MNMLKTLLETQEKKICPVGKKSNYVSVCRIRQVDFQHSLQCKHAPMKSAAKPYCSQRFNLRKPFGNMASFV